MRDTFSDYHPLVNFLYFTLVLAGAIILLHPLAQVISLVCATVYAVRQEGRKAVIFSLKFCLPMLLLTALVNPAFNHAGITTLVYLPTGNPLTLESVLYGVSAGAMLATALLWFRSFNRVITSDKFIYLFGRILPALSLLLSMTLRFVPKFKAQMAVVAEGQRSIGRDPAEGSLLRRARIAVTIVSIMITWSLENAIETADSMKSRGYGLKGRTAFSIYRFKARDRTAMCWLGFCALYLLAGGLCSAYAFRYFPSIRGTELSPSALCFYFMYFGLCITPVVLNTGEERRWNSILSKM